MSGGIAQARLADERKSWRKSHPHGFVAKPERSSDGTVNLLVWHCLIPGKRGTDWEGGHFPLTIRFNEGYPNKPPLCDFPRNFFHPNVYESGAICLSILSNDWKPCISVKQILVGIQFMLNHPNPASPASHHACQLFTKNPDEYKEKIRLQAEKYPQQIC